MKNEQEKLIFQVVTITNNLEEYPESREDTEMFSHLVPHVKDEQELFVVDLNTGDWWPAEQFFLMNEVRQFVVVDGNMD